MSELPELVPIKPKNTPFVVIIFAENKRLLYPLRFLIAHQIVVGIHKALSKAQMSLAEMDAVAVTYGPGLVGALLVGVAEAKAAPPCQRLPQPHHPWSFLQSDSGHNPPPGPDGYALLTLPGIEKEAPNLYFQYSWR